VRPNNPIVNVVDRKEWAIGANGVVPWLQEMKKDAGANSRILDRNEGRPFGECTLLFRAGVQIEMCYC